MTAVLVPITLDVLVVRETTSADDWSLTALAVPKPQTQGRRRQKLVPDPFQTLPSPRPPGAYLHWALPDGLTHGLPAGGTGGFPPLPNRWLVVRLSGPASPGPRAVEAWLLPDSGAKVPVRLTGALAGPALPPAGEAPVEPLTAVGHGDLGWAAYYDNVVDRFALYDDLAGVTGPVAYLVCGWYTNPGQDPLAATSESDFHARMERMAWDLAVPLGSGVPYPTASVYHAAALAIGWPDPSWAGDGGSLGKELDLRPDAATVEVSLGETLAEAVAALTPEGPSPRMARLLEGSLAGALGEIASADGPAALDTALHTSRFGSTPSAARTEYIWEPAPPTAGTVDTGTGGAFRQVRRTRPRVWHALDPSIVVHGGGRSPKHGGDGRYTETGHLVCRTDIETVTAFGVEGGDPGRGADVLPAAPLAGLPATYGVPSVAARLLIELASLDPGSSPDLAASTATTPSPVASARARWWAAFDPATPPADALADAHVEGTLPSPVGVTPPMRPWSPLHLEWSAAYLHSPRGAHDWMLADVDFELPDAVTRPDPDPDHPLSGRVMLSAAPAAVLGEAGGDGDVGGPNLRAEDLLSGTLAEVAAQLRGDKLTAVVHAKDASAEMDPGKRPDNFLALRAGFLRLERLRLVDGFGQHVDLLGSGAEGVALRFGATLAVPGEPDLGALRPRFTALARVLLRFADADGDQVEAGAGVSPVCGYLVVSPLDGTLEFFDADGVPHGRLRPDATSGAAWEDDPGRSSALGARPSSVLPNPFLGRLADGLIAADVTAMAAGAGRPVGSALRSLVRVLDITRWTVDLTGRSGDEHLALLLGHPVAVVRAVIQVEVQDPRKPPENERTAVPVKLGTLAHLQDGLLAYFVGDDFDRMHLVDPAVGALAGETGEGPIDSPYVDPSHAFYVNPGIPVPLTLLMVPGSDVHVTTGLLPQKRVGLLREWTAPALSRLSPVLRFGPVVRDGDATRLPVSPDIRGNWLWHRRADPGTWATDEVVPATISALLPDEPVRASDGWLQVKLLPDTTYLDTGVQVEITCIRSRRFHGGRQVLAVGGRNADGSHFLLPVLQAVQLQETGRFAFYVDRVPGKRVWTRVIQTRRGVKYLRTTADRKDPNNLVRLPECAHA